MIEKIRERLFYKQFIQPGDLCFDIGANIGDKTRTFLELGARVIAVEPQNLCVEILRRLYGNHPNMILVDKAVGAKEGTTVMYVNHIHTLTTLSAEWIKKIGESKRFGNQLWNSHIPISLTTLDHLICQYGMPKFCKIDVEGYEYQVLQGLSHPLPALSIEFANEYIENTIRCIEYLSQLGNYEFNYSLSNIMQMALPFYVDLAAIAQIMQHGTLYTWGDVYARLIN